MRQARDEAAANRVGDTNEHDRKRAAFPLQRNGTYARECEDRVGSQRNQLPCERLRPLGARRGVPIIDADIIALGPSESFESLAESRKARLHFRIAFRAAHQYADPPHALALLRARRERPRGCSAAKKRDELAPSYL